MMIALRLRSLSTSLVSPFSVLNGLPVGKNTFECIIVSFALVAYEVEAIEEQWGMQTC